MPGAGQIVLDLVGLFGQAFDADRCLVALTLQTLVGDGAGGVKPADRLADPKVAEALAWAGVLVERRGWEYEAPHRSASTRSPSTTFSATPARQSSTNRHIQPAALPTTERQARYWIDIARAFDRWGKPDRCYRALLTAEHAAPQEVRHASLRTIAADLMQHDRTLPGVRAFANRIQALA
ncbi:hypothetical protein [Streptomyces sp. SYSU K21746]